MHTAVTSRVKDPLVEYHFLREDCIAKNGLFEDITGMDLLGQLQRDIDRTTCLRGNGIRGVASAAQGKAALISTKDISQMIPFFKGSEVSLEFWVRSEDTYVSETSLFAFGERSNLASYAVRIDYRTSTHATSPRSLYLRAQNRVGSIIVLEASRLPRSEYAHVVIDIRYLSPLLAGKQFSMISENMTINATSQTVYE